MQDSLMDFENAGPNNCAEAPDARKDEQDVNYTSWDTDLNSKLSGSNASQLVLEI